PHRRRAAGDGQDLATPRPVPGPPRAGLFSSPRRPRDFLAASTMGGMDSLDLQVLAQARDWRHQGNAVWLVTVLETWGSAPRPPGALLAMRDDGQVAGSVSGGCVEDDLIDRVRKGERVGKPSLVAYGVTKEEAARFGLPCGGNLRLVQEPLDDFAWIDEVFERTGRHELVARVLDLESGKVRV